LFRVVVTLIFALLVSMNAWAESWKQNKFDNGRSEPDNMLSRLPDKYLEMYHSRSDKYRTGSTSYSVDGSSNPVQFQKSVEKHPRLDEVMATSSSFSFLFLEDGEVIYDELPPEGRFKKTFSNDTYFPSHSIGKSITSYMIGHAICKGYIASIDAPLDFPLMQNTLYFGQPIINLLNMVAGDRHVIGRSTFISSGRKFHGDFPLLSAVQAELKDTQPLAPVGSNQHYYSNYTSDILYSFLMYKVGAKDWDSFLRYFFQEHIRVEKPIFWQYLPTTTNYNVTLEEKIEQGVGRYGFYATRYDFLRIANSIMTDWQNNTCEGLYLKELYERRVNRNINVSFSNYSWQPGEDPGSWANSAEYAGQFYAKLNGLEDRTILALVGALGQEIIIDMGKSRIAVVSSNQERYVDGRTLLYEPIKYGRIQKKPDMIADALTKVSKTKYDRTTVGMTKRFECLKRYAIENGLAAIPSNQEIEKLISNLANNYFYRSHRQIVKAGISKEAMDANKKALVRLVNFEGTNEEYCSKPVL